MQRVPDHSKRAGLPEDDGERVDEIRAHEQGRQRHGQIRPRHDQPAAREPGAGLLLQAISERDGKPIAVLNSRVVHEGDRFDGVTVVRIGADEVEIEVQGQRRVLRF